VKISLGPGSGAPTSTVAEFDSYLRAAAGAGFDAVSLNPEHLATAVLDGAAGLRRAARMIGDHGLTCTDILSLTIRSQERDEYDSAQRLIEMAQAVSAESLVTVCFTARPTACSPGWTGSPSWPRRPA
jgi:sugar phosphate isomerase/epimerase